MREHYAVDYEQYKKPAESIKNMATATGLPLTRIAEIIPDLQRDILRTWHTGGENKKADVLVEKAFERLFGYPFNNRADRIVPMMIKGPPGQGKTTAFRQALKNIANAMGVNLYINPTTDVIPKPEDIIVVESQLAGMLSPTPLIGVPSQGDERVPSEKGTTIYLPPSRLKKMVDAQFSLFLLDDLENANPGIKNVTLSALLDKILADMNLGKNCYVGATGNLGSLDGTNTTLGSDALYNRTDTRLGYDTMGDWIERNMDKYQDEIGLCFLDEFFIQNPEMFYPARDPKLRGPSATSRSYDGLLSTIRNVIGDYVDQENAGLNPAPIFSIVTSKLQGQVGPKAAKELELFYNDVLTIAFPAAREAFSDKGLSKEMRGQLHSIIAKNKTPESEGLSRSYLRQITQIASDRIFKTLNQPTDGDYRADKIKQSVAYKVASQYMEACYSVGLIEGNRSNLLAQSLVNFAANLVKRSESLPEAEKHFDFGKLTATGIPVPNEQITKLLTLGATKTNDPQHGEALLRVGGTDDKPITALQTTLIDPLTQVSDSMTLKQNAEDARMQMR